MESTSLGFKKLLEDGADPVTAYREAINANAAQANAVLSELAGPWEPLTLSAKVREESSGVPTPRARIELLGNIVRLRGMLEVRSGDELKIGETLATLPVGLRPKLDDSFAAALVNTAKPPVWIEVQTTGGLIVEAALGEKDLILLSGCTFALT